MAVRSCTLAFLGRLCFALVFLASAAQKLHTFHPRSGGAVTQLFAPKLDNFFLRVLGKASELTGLELAFEKESYPVLVGVLITVELLGAVLFLFDSDTGALLLGALLAFVTPVIHNWWDSRTEEAKLAEMVMFFKNVALFGALLFYAGGKPRLVI